MKTRFTLLAMVLLPFISFSQFMDDFSIDTINTDIWFGDLVNFTVNGAHELQLFDEDPLQPTSSIWSEVSIGDSTNWTFYYRQDFSASGSNFSKIYLSSSNSDLSGELNGYFIKLGGITGDADRVELYRQTGMDTELLISGKDSMLAMVPSEGRIQVRRNNAGLWTLLADYTGGNNFTVEGTATDQTHPFGAYFGIYCKYSSSRSDLFFFDDILISPLFVDTRPPEVVDLRAVDELHLNLLFDEPLDKASAELVSNYQLSPAVAIASALQNPANEAAVQLTFASPLTSQQAYDVQILGVADKNGNPQTNQVVSFTFNKIEDAAPFDILINEIFADPSPVIGLPETEYLELYNRSEKIINLENFILADNTSELVLPDQLLFPEQHLILYKTGTGDFSAFGDTLPISNFFGLGNSFDDLVLYDPNGEVVHAVFYQKSWYQNNGKAEGGFSLELINPRVPCSFRDNWIVSASTLGGTPGQENSVLDKTATSDDLDLFRVFPLFGGNRVELIFNKSLDLATAADINNYEIDGIPITAAEASPVLFNQVILTLGTFLETKTVYTLRVKNTFTDCVGASAPSELVTQFGLPEAYGAGDIIINEVLFNPQVGGVDFVELYNRSEKIVDISNLLLANRDDNSEINQVAPVFSNYLLLPDQYVVLTTNPVDIQSRYTVENPKAFVTLSNLPSFPDTTENVIIYFNQDNESVFVDEFKYSAEFHNPLLADKNGVSLERIFPNSETQDPSNWHSAAEKVGFATPTYRNSQDGEDLSLGEDLVSIPYTTFSPDSDGFRDFLSIQYQTPESGFLANVRIFDVKGRLVKTLTQNELLGTQGILQWDGTTAEGSKARVGIYLLWIELFHPDGTVVYFKENCVLAGQLN